MFLHELILLIYLIQWLPGLIKSTNKGWRMETTVSNSTWEKESISLMKKSFFLFEITLQSCAHDNDTKNNVAARSNKRITDQFGTMWMVANKAVLLRSLTHGLNNYRCVTARLHLDLFRARFKKILSIQLVRKNR